MHSTHAVSAAIISTAILLLPSSLGSAHADDLSGDVVGCAVDVPCINELYQNGATLHIGWDGHEDYDHYNLRWSRPGRGETQYETSGGSHGAFSINNVHADVVYSVKVQGCNTDFFGNSTCSGWGEAQFKAKANLPYGPDTCKQGYVWREARPSDHVCVTSAVRSQTAQENQLAASRRSPNGGAYGPATCQQGYVWREAFAGDHVCVVPQSRSAASADNAAAAARRAAG